MNTKRRLLLAIPMAAIAASTSSCLIATPLTLERMYGTYQIASYIRTDYKTKKETNLLEKYDYESYYVLGPEGGYYVYKTNDEYYTSVINISYSLNDNGKCRRIDYVNGKNDEYYFSTTTFDAQPALQRSYVAAFSFTTVTKYKKISDDSSLNFLEEKLDRKLPHVTFEQYKYDGIYVSDNWHVGDEGSVYNFFYLHTDSLVVDFYSKNDGDENPTITHTTASENEQGFTINDEEYLKVVDEYESITLVKGEEIFYQYGVVVQNTIDQFEEQFADLANEVE